ncbi:MAG: hypothetical protein ACOC6O_01305 [Chloroflexota bacterium]
MPMRKRKWFIPVVVVSVLLIGGIVGGAVALADDSDTADPHQMLVDRVAAIYEEETGVAIDSEQLKSALDQARSEIRGEALENRLQDLVDDGQITQDEASQYLEWWQSRPDIKLPLPRLGRHLLGGCMMRGGCSSVLE